MGRGDDVFEPLVPGHERVGQPRPLHVHRDAVPDDPSSHAPPRQENLLESESLTDEHSQQVIKKVC